MTPDETYDRLMLLQQSVRKNGQAATARELGYSDAAVCQVLRGTYKGDTARILQRTAEVYGTETIACPVLGSIPLGRCADERRTPISSASPRRLRLGRACRKCEVAG